MGRLHGAPPWDPCVGRLFVLAAQREEEGYEQLRSPDVIDSKDMFTFDFELNSLAHGEWLAAEGTI